MKIEEKKIRIIKVPPEKDYILVLHLEDEENGGGEVHDFITTPSYIDVQFVNNRAAKHFLEIGSITIDDISYKIVPVYDENQINSIQVTGLNDQINELLLTMYFENLSKVTEDSLEMMNFDSKEGYATCTFTVQQALMRILEINTHKVMNCPLEICQIPDDLADFKNLSCAIKVFFMSPGKISDTSVRDFFENRQCSGGDEIDESFFDAKGEFAVFTYSHRNIVKRVLQKHEDSTLKFGDVTFDVKKMEPVFSPILSSRYDIEPNRLIVQRLPHFFKNEELDEYFQKISIKVSKMLFGRTCPGVALLILSQNFEFQTLLRLVYSRPFKGQMLSILQVKQPDMIQVFKASKLSEESLRSYFSAKKFGKSNVIKFFLGPDFAVLQFSESAAVTKILAMKNHQIGSEKVDVSVFYEGIGGIGSEKECSSCACWLPQCSVVQCDSVVVQFMLAFKKYKQEFEAEFDESLGASIEWPAQNLLNDGVSGKIELRIKFTAQDSRSFSNLEKLKNWDQDCKSLFEKKIKDLKVKKIDLLQDIWDHVIKSLKEKLEASQHIQGNNEIECHILSDLMVIYHLRNCSISLCGLETAVENLKKMIIILKMKEETRLNEIKMMVKETVPKTKALEISRKFGFFDSMEGMKEKVGDVSLNFTEDGQLILTGLPDDVTRMKMNMHEFFNGLEQKNKEIEPFLASLLNQQQFQDHIIDLLQSRKLNVRWQLAMPKNLILYAQNQDEIAAAFQLLRSELLHQKRELDDNEKHSLMRDEWKSKYEEIKSFPLLEVEVNSKHSEILLSGTSDAINQALELFKMYVDQFAIYEKCVPIPRGCFAFMMKHLSDDIKQLQEDFKSCFITIHPSREHSEYRVRGTNIGLQRVVDKVVALSQMVICKKKSFVGIGYHGYFQGEDGRGQVSRIENMTKTHIQEYDPELDKIESSKYYSGDNNCYAIAELKNKITLEIVLGSIVKSNVDVIVNAANSRLEHVGGVAQVISEAAGPEMQKECRDYVNNKGKLDVRQVFVSKPGRLNLKAILHTVGPIYRPGNVSAVNHLYEAVYNVLDMADKNNWKRIALPAISTGVYGFPLEEAANTILDSVVDFSKKSKNLSLVQIVDINSVAVNEFRKCINKKIPSAHIKFSKEIEEKHILKKVPWKDAETSFNFSSVKTPPEYRTKSSNKEIPLKITNHPPLKLVKGSLVDQQVDVIVNSAAPDLNLSRGTIAKLILSKAGLQIQSDCADHVTQHGQLKYGEIHVTQPYSLSCKFVFHGVCAAWDHQKGICESSIRSVTRLSLEEASKRNLSSIAMPSFGTGQLQVPPVYVAKWMYEETEYFFEKNPNSSLVDLRLVVYDKDVVTLQAIEGFLNNNLSSQNRGERKLMKSSSLHQFQSLPSPVDEIESGFAVDIGKIVIEVCQGDITNETTDVIVNSTNDRCDFKTGAVSSAILKKGGISIEQECKNKGWSNSNLIVTSGGALSCRYIFHINAMKAGEKWSSIKDCLSTADQMKLSSLSFPLLGTGNLTNIRDSADEMSKIIFKHILEFANKSPSHLTRIRVLILKSEMMSEFQKVVEKEISSSGGMFRQFKNFVKKTYNEYISSNPTNKVNKTVSMHSFVSPKPNNKSMQFMLNIYASSQSDIDNAELELDALAKDAMTTKVISDPWKAAIQQLSNEEVAFIQSVGTHFDIDVNIEKHKKSITLKGINKNIFPAEKAIIDVLINVEKSFRESAEAEQLSIQVQWCYKDLDYVPYPKDINCIIEKAYLKKDEKKEFKVSWKEEQGTFEIDFQKMVETCSSGLKEVHVVKRKEIGDNSLPLTWDTMEPEKPFIKVQVNRLSNEYQDIEKSIVLSSGKSVNNIIKIERIQHNRMFKEYLITKNKMLKTYKNRNLTIEQNLWYGADEGRINDIDLEGINRSHNEVLNIATPLGRGSYFSKDFSDAASTSQLGQSGHKYVYRCMVLVGEYTKGSSNLKEAPTNPNGGKFDSVVDDTANPHTFVVFNDAHAYPEYLITFN